MVHPDASRLLSSHACRVTAADGLTPTYAPTQLPDLGSTIPCIRLVCFVNHILQPLRPVDSPCPDSFQNPFSKITVSPSSEIKKTFPPVLTDSPSMNISCLIGSERFSVFSHSDSSYKKGSLMMFHIQSGGPKSGQKKTGFLPDNTVSTACIINYGSSDIRMGPYEG